MPSLMPSPGTLDDPAELGQPVTLRTDAPAAFGIPEGAVQLKSEAQSVDIPPANVEWGVDQVTARLPSAVADPVGPFTIRVVPAVGEPLSAPLVLEDSIRAALEKVVARLQLLVDLGDGKGALGKQSTDVSPEALQRVTLSLQAPATQLKGPARPRPASARGATGRKVIGNVGTRPVPRSDPPVLSPETTGRLTLTGVAPGVTQVLADAELKADVRLEMSAVDGALRADETLMEPRRDILGFGVAVAPLFTEARKSGGKTRRVRVQARVTARAEFLDETIDIPEVRVPAEPIELNFLPVGIPTLLALYRHRKYELVENDGFVLIVTAGSSGVPAAAGKIEDVIQPVLFDFSRTNAGLAFFLQRIPALAPVMRRLVGFILAAQHAERAGVESAPLENLNRITMVDRSGFLHNDTEADRQVSSLMMLGRPGAQADLYCKKRFKPEDGHLRIRLTDDLPVNVAAFPTLPDKPKPTFDEMPEVDGELGDAADGVLVSRPVPPQRENGAGNKVYADNFRSVELRTPEQGSD